MKVSLGLECRKTYKVLSTLEYSYTRAKRNARGGTLLIAGLLPLNAKVVTTCHLVAHFDVVDVFAT